MIHNVSLENFKGTTADIDLKQLNIFRGTSGSGKSTWLEAVRVAILGHDPGYGKLLSETMAFASGPRMSVAVSTPEFAVKRVFEDRGDGRTSQSVVINGDKKTKAHGESLVAEHFGKFPMMLNPDEFFEMSDDKKISFLFGLYDAETNGEVIRRDCLVRILGRYTDAVPLIMEYEFKMEDYHGLKDQIFDKLIKLAIDKVAKKDVEAGRALTKIFSELMFATLGTGQEALSMYVNVLKNEINATRRAKGDAEAANRKLMEEKTDKLKLINYNDVENQEEVERLRKEISEIEKELHAREKLSSAKERLMSGLEIHAASVARYSEASEKIKALLMSKTDKEESDDMLGELEVTRQMLAKKIFVGETKRLKLEKKYAQTISDHDAVTTQFICKVCGEELECKCVKITEKDKLKSEKAVQEASIKVTEVYEHVECVLGISDANEEDMNDLLEALTINEANEQSYEISFKHQKDLEQLVTEEKANLDNIEEPGAGDDTLKAQLSGLKVTLGERLVAAKNHDWLRTLSATISRANETISNSTALLTALSMSISEVKLVRDELTASATSSIEKVANGLLEKVDEKFGLMYDINDGKFEVRCVNVSGKVVPFKTLSGGEKVLYLSAQLLALMTIVDPKLKILEVEMGELSGNLVPTFMDALEAMTKDRDIQVVLSSCHGDFEVEGDSWAIHEMGE